MIAACLRSEGKRLNVPGRVWLQVFEMGAGAGLNLRRKPGDSCLTPTSATHHNFGVLPKRYVQRLPHRTLWHHSAIGTSFLTSIKTLDTPDSRMTGISAVCCVSQTTRTAGRFVRFGRRRRSPRQSRSIPWRININPTVFAASLSNSTSRVAVQDSKRARRPAFCDRFR